MTINGKLRENAGGMTLAELLEAEGYKPDQVAVGRNGRVVPRGDYALILLADNDEIEVFHFMGGGALVERTAEKAAEKESPAGEDSWTLGGRRFSSRFILGSGKYSLSLIRAAVENAGAQMITLALRRANPGGKENILDYIPPGVTLLPNTSGARNAEEAVKIARFAREICGADFIKIEVIRDSKYLLPDNGETIRAAEILAGEGFVVMPYMFPDLNAAHDLIKAGAACVMPLAAPIGSNRGLQARDFIRILIEEIDAPVIVDAGIGKPSQACEVMEMGAAAVMANTAIATAGDVPAMAEAFKAAIEAGRLAYLSGLGRVLDRGASASSPLTGFLHEDAGSGD